MGQEIKPNRGSPPGSSAGMFWLAGWLFTIGLCKLGWWKILIGLVVWPLLSGRDRALSMLR